MKPPNVGGAAKPNSLLSTYISSADDGEKKDEKLPVSLCKEGISWQGWTERKKIAELFANEKAMGLLLGFLKSTEVGGREGAKERELEWMQRDDWIGEELLGA